MSDALTVSVRAEALLARFQGAEGRLREELRVAVAKLAIKAQAKVKGEKLTGQVLHARTGTLRRSINYRVEENPSGVYAKVGTNMRYAAIHEYGFDGSVNIREHARRSRQQMQLARFRTRKDGTRVEIKGSYAKAGGGAGVVNVRAHVRNVVMPERSFLRSTANEMAPDIEKGLRSAVLKALGAK